MSELSESFMVGQAKTDEDKLMENLVRSYVDMDLVFIKAIEDNYDQADINGMICNATMAHVGFRLKLLYENLDDKNDIYEVANMMKDHIDIYIKSFDEY